MKSINDHFGYVEINGMIILGNSWGRVRRYVTEAEEVILTVDEAELDLGGARGISLFDESGTAPRMSDGFEAEGMPIGSCGAYTVTLKVDLSSFGNGDAIFAMYDTQISTPYLLTTCLLAHRCPLLF